VKLVRWSGGTGRIDGDTIVPLAGSVTELARRATTHPGWVAPPAGDAVGLNGVHLLPPVDVPGAFRDFYAFERHVRTARAGRGLDMDAGWYERPVFYFSNPASLLGPDAVVAPPARSSAVDFELELGWLVGDDLSGCDLEHAANTIVGYTVLCDWSARDLQREEMTQSLGPVKGKDFATSVGPVVVTADEMDCTAGAMRAWVNGRLCSEADLSECYWTLAEMTSYAAESTVVRAGDLFGSGTCGTGCLLELSLTYGSESYPWLVAGCARRSAFRPGVAGGPMPQPNDLPSDDGACAS
jgi:2-keto-4-pentenoate hydratase/2-oxohepta-3-ene-1,7-dioic acid hydratase in catechol pathway